MILSTLEDVLNASVSVTDHRELASLLKQFLKRDIAEQLLASALQNDVDPLTLLAPDTNSLGYLYILYVTFSISSR